MNDQDILQLFLDEIHAVAKDQLVKLNIPMLVVISEADLLAARALIDLDKLSQFKITAERIERLSNLCACCRATYNNFKQYTDESEEEWKVEYPKGVNLRNELVAICELCFYTDEVLMEKVTAIKAGDTINDTISDLGELAVMARANESLLTEMGFTLDLFITAENMVTSLSTLLANANADRYMASDPKMERDQALTLLDKDVEYIRRCGQFVFRNDPDTIKHYSSQYARLRNSRNYKDSKANDESE